MTGSYDIILIENDLTASQTTSSLNSPEGVTPTPAWGEGMKMEAKTSGVKLRKEASGPPRAQPHKRSCPSCNFEPSGFQFQPFTVAIPEGLF